MTGSDDAREPSNGPSPRARFVHLAAVVLGAIIVLVVVGRALGPSGLYQNTDECKTIACTADVAINANWKLPRDSTGTPSRKPPLFNWLGAPIIALGFYDEWAYKVPSILAGIAMAGVCVWMARRMFARLGEQGRHPDDPGICAGATGLAIAAGAVWVSTPASVKYAYFGRQDMLFATLLGAGWACMTVALEAQGRQRLAWSAAGWAAAVLAALTKGPFALVIPLYALLASLLIHRSWRRFHALGWWWGLPLVFIVPFAWVGLAYPVDPDFVGSQLLGKELVGRLERGTTETEPLRVLIATWRIPGHIIERFAPWGVFTLAALVLIPPHRWLRHPLAPAVLWLLVWYVMLLIFAGSAGSYVVPMAPAVAILATYACARFSSKLSWSGAHLATIALIVACGTLSYEVFFSRGARSGLGNNIARFAREARELTGDDAVVFVGTEYNPVSTLMGRHQSGEATPAMLDDADWAVGSLIKDGPEPRLSTAQLVRMHLQDEPIHARKAGLGLYRTDEVRLEDFGVSPQKPEPPSDSDESAP